MTAEVVFAPRAVEQLADPDCSALACHCPGRGRRSTDCGDGDVDRLIRREVGNEDPVEDEPAYGLPFTTVRDEKPLPLRVREEDRIHPMCRLAPVTVAVAQRQHAPLLKRLFNGPPHLRRSRIVGLIDPDPRAEAVRPLPCA